MSRYFIAATFKLILCSVFVIGLTNLAFAEKSPVSQENTTKILGTQRLFIGVIEKVKAPILQVYAGTMDSRYLSVNESKGTSHSPAKTGDSLILVVNDNNEVVEYHGFGEDHWYFLIKGTLIGTSDPEEDLVLVLYEGGRVRLTPVDPETIPKVKKLSAGKSANFLLNDSFHIIDVK